MRLRRSERGCPIVDISQLRGEGKKLVLGFRMTTNISLQTYSKRGWKEDSLQNPYDPRFRLVKYQIIDLVITVDRRPPILRLGLLITEELEHLLNMRDLSDSFLRIDVHGCSLRFADRAKSSDLPVVEARVFSEV